MFGRPKPKRQSTSPVATAMPAATQGDIIEIVPEYIDPYVNKSGNTQWFVKTPDKTEFVVWDQGIMEALALSKGTIIRVQVKAAPSEGLKATIAAVVG